MVTIIEGCVTHIDVNLRRRAMVIQSCFERQFLLSTNYTDICGAATRAIMSTTYFSAVTLMRPGVDRWPLVKESNLIFLW
jgi:hypothetical protein